MLCQNFQTCQECKRLAGDNTNDLSKSPYFVNEVELFSSKVEIPAGFVKVSRFWSGQALSAIFHFRCV